MKGKDCGFYLRCSSHVSTTYWKNRKNLIYLCLRKKIHMYYTKKGISKKLRS